jgi:hypothetical protein
MYSPKDIVEVSRDTTTPAERSSLHLYTLLEDKLAAEKKKLDERYAAELKQLNTLVCMHPDVPFTAANVFPHKLEVTKFLRQSRIKLSLMQDDKFLAYESTREPYAKKVSEMFFEKHCRRLHIPCLRDELVERKQYQGKIVYVLPAGTESEVAVETENTIVLPPCPDDALFYDEYLYRDRHDVVKSYFDLIENDDKVEDIVHFGNTPWKVSEWEEGTFTNVIFHNMHTDEKRRYILKSSPAMYLMLAEEIFYFPTEPEYIDKPLIHCASGESVKEFSFVKDCISTESYAVIVTGHSIGHLDEMHFLFTSEEV